MVLLRARHKHFCHQYSYIDEMNALAWRKVWKIWKEKYPENCISSLCLIDYLVYKIIGKQFCKDILYKYQCVSEGHHLYWHTNKNKTCQICYKNNRLKNVATVISKSIPCSNEYGFVAIENTNASKESSSVLFGIKECPFKNICEIDNGKQLKDAPKSISIFGRTGWNESRAKKGVGGGGMMGNYFLNTKIYS